MYVPSVAALPGVLTQISALLSGNFSEDGGSRMGGVYFILFFIYFY